MGNGRVPLTAQLVPGKDDDLIEWLTGIESGNRAGVIKEVVRAGLGLPPKEQPLTGGGVDTSHLVTHDDLEDLRAQLNGWGDELTKYVLDQMMLKLSEMAGTGFVPTVVQDDGQEIDRQRKQRRESKIKAAQW